MAATKKVIIIAGPTAVGKTSVAIALAQHLQTEIISADSRQCYKELSIGVARPSAGELAAVPHHFIASHSIHEKVTAATFENYAMQKAEATFHEKDVAVMVGGTGLYIKAFCEGLDIIPEVSTEIRDHLTTEYKKNGIEWLQKQVAEKDPAFFSSGEIQNPHRLLRALEVFSATGQSILTYRKGMKAKRPFEVIKIGLELPKEQLHQNINSRVDKMMTEGLLDEVKALIPYQHLTALQTVGYKELFDYFNKLTDLETAIEAIKQNTRHYAKRQLTWFRKDAAYRWFAPDDLEKIKKHL